jgi:uncharacterized membrane protein YdfJ with MMPL/SSD domain
MLPFIENDKSISDIREDIYSALAGLGKEIENYRISWKFSSNGEPAYTHIRKLTTYLEKANEKLNQMKEELEKEVGKNIYKNILV